MTQQVKTELTQNIPPALINFDSMPDSAFIRLPVIKALYGVSSATIWRGVKNQTIPKPISLPIDRHAQDTHPFFKDCMNWTRQNFAGELLSFDVHLDEAAPHAHALILPLINGKMQGRDMVGNIGNLMRLINNFHADVAKHYGLSRNESKRLTQVDKQTLENQVLMQLKSDPAMQSSVWACVRDAIHNDPLPFAHLLSIEVAATKQTKAKSFIDHKRSKGKGSFIQ